MRKVSLYAGPVMLAAILLTFVPRFRAADTIPNQITEQDAFWKLIDSSSGAFSGAFQSENFLSNETGFQAVIPTLMQTIKPKWRVHGSSVRSRTFTYIAALRPKIAFIVDIRRQNMLEHMIYISRCLRCRLIVWISCPGCFRENAPRA